MPSSLERALRMALAKEPSDRFDNVMAFAEALAAAQVSPEATVASRANTVVVLPFVNRSGAEDNEYFSDGLTEEVISDLTGLAKLRGPTWETITAA